MDLRDHGILLIVEFVLRLLTTVINRVVGSGLGSAARRKQRIMNAPFLFQMQPQRRNGALHITILHRVHRSEIRLNRYV